MRAAIGAVQREAIAVSARNVASSIARADESGPGARRRRLPGRVRSHETGPRRRRPRGARESSIGADGSSASPDGPAPDGPSPQSGGRGWLERNAVDCLPEGALEQKLALGRPLRVKLGIDPTAPDIHLGHTVVLQKLREFQDLGHGVVLIIGDYTARVGDPSGRSATRPALSGGRDRRQRPHLHQEQAFTVLDPERTRGPLQRRMARHVDGGAVRAGAHPDRRANCSSATTSPSGSRPHAPISVLELLYPLMQGYDSVAIRADVELGGTDQKFNLLLGRDIQRAYGVPEQAILTMPLLPGTDGVRRMSKSIGNYIGVTEPPEEIYGKTLSIPDSRSRPGTRCCWAPSRRPTRPRATPSARWPATLVARFHGDDAAEAAEQEFDRVHVDRQAPEEMPIVDWPADAAPVHLPGAAARCVRDHDLRGAPAASPRAA